jgi:hypothetical protein
MYVPLRRARVCRYCPEGTGIIWDPEDAIRTAEGDLKCLKCVETDTRKMMIRVIGADHPKNKSAIDEKQKEVDQWNTYAQSINDLNKRMGGTRDFLT